MKLLPASKCQVAGRTSDGRLCYYGKKDSVDPDAKDLTLWITLDRPRADASNYTRLSRVGYDEAQAYREGSEVPLKDVAEWEERRVSEFLSGVHSRDLKKHAGVGDV